MLSCSLQVHNCPRMLLALTWHADLAPQNTSWLKHFIKRHQRNHLHHLLASGLRDLHGGVHGQGTVVASSGSAHAVAERVRHAHPQRDATAREPRGLDVSAGPSAMSPSLSTGVRRHAGPSQARRCRRQPRIARTPRGRGEQPRRRRRRRRRGRRGRGPRAWGRSPTRRRTRAGGPQGGRWTAMEAARSGACGR